MPRTHDEVQEAVWNDERHMPPGTREVALAVAWVLYREPASKDHLWTRVRDLLGPDGVIGGRQHWRLHDLVAGDAPRYDHGRWSMAEGSCEGPRMRPYRPRRPAWADHCLVADHHPHVGDCRYPVVYGEPSPPPERDDTVCGAHATIHVTERDMTTGWETVHWFCTRHRQRAAEVKAMLAARGTPPEPIPNSGGLLPRYFAGDWAAIYARHCERCWMVRMTGWTVPYHGIDADDWPVPGKTMIPKRPRLSLVASA